MPTGPKVSVVVCTYQRRALLERTLEALDRQTYPADRLEVIVVDNGSSDGTAALLRTWGGARADREVVRFETNQRVGVARNAGLHIATGEVVAFTDDDCRPLPTWVAALAEAMTSGVDIVQGRTVPDPAQPMRPGSRTQWVLGIDSLFETCNIAYRRSTLDALGDAPFRTVVQDRLEQLVGARLATQPFGEDVDLGWRAVRAGAGVAYADPAVVHHEVLPPSSRVLLHRAAVAAGFPILTEEVPELRDALYWRRWFLSRDRPAAWALVAGLVAVLSGPRALGVALLGGWTLLRLDPRRPGCRARARGLPLAAAREVVETAALGYSSARTGTVVL